MIKIVLIFFYFRTFILFNAPSKTHTQYRSLFSPTHPLPLPLLFHFKNIFTISDQDQHPHLCRPLDFLPVAISPNTHPRSFLASKIIQYFKSIDPSKEVGTVFPTYLARTFIHLLLGLKFINRLQATLLEPVLLTHELNKTQLEYLQK
jgi:hypothetical protein